MNRKFDWLATTTATLSTWLGQANNTPIGLKNWLEKVSEKAKANEDAIANKVDKAAGQRLLLDTEAATWNAKATPSDITAAKLVGYVKATVAGNVAATDSISGAIGKLEKKADDNTTSLGNKLDKTTIATDAEVQAGTESTKFVTSQRLATWWQWLLSRPLIFKDMLTLEAYAGTTTRFLSVSPAGVVSANSLEIENAYTTDTDIINAINTAAWNQYGRATISPLNSKVFRQGLKYADEFYIYEAINNNIVKRY